MDIKRAGTVASRRGNAEWFSGTEWADAMWIPPGEKHWHGAAPTTGMSHIAIHEALDGDYATWMEHVSDAQYAAAPQAD